MFFSCLLTTWLFCLGKCQFKSLTHFLKNVLFAFLIINFKCSSCTLDTNLLSDAYVEDFFFQFVTYLFIFLKQSFLSLKSNLVFFKSIFSFIVSVSLCPINKFCLFQGCEDFFLFSSRSFIVLRFIFRPVVRFESFF